jgi:hypothetical protein
MAEGRISEGRRIAKAKLLTIKTEHGTVQVCTKNFIHRL